MRASQFNSIAVRIAITIILAIVVGITIEIAVPAVLERFGSNTHVILSRSAVLVVEPARNAQMASSNIATLVHVLARCPARQKIVGVIDQRGMQVALHATPLPQAQERDDSRLSFLLQLIRMQLEDLSPSPPVTVHRLADVAQHIDPDTDSGSKKGALVEIGLPGAQWRPSGCPIFRSRRCPGPRCF